MPRLLQNIPLLLPVCLGLSTLCLALGTARATAQGLPEVMGINAPGQGKQNSSASAIPASAYDSQRDMFANLLQAAPSLEDDEALLAFYRPMSFEPLAEEDIGSRVRPRKDVEIVRDRIHWVPRVRGETREAAMFGAGYARAQDRLWQMDVNRHIWRSRLIEILGRGDNNEHLEQDLMTAQRNDYSEAELQAMFDQLDERFGEWGALVQSDLAAYVAGTNAFIAEVLAEESLLPAEYKARAIQPGQWRVTDYIAEAAHSSMSYRTGTGKLLGPREVGNARLLQQLQAKYGEEAGYAVFRDMRNRDDADVQTVHPTRRAVNLDQDDPRALALPDLGSYEALHPLEGFTAGYRLKAEADSGRSNALLVDGRFTTSGRPISVQGPQDGFAYPHFYNSEIQIVGPDLAAHGILELYGPYPFNGGRGATFAASLTSQYTDTADTFVLKLCDDSAGQSSDAPTHYVYRGECIPFDKITRERQALGESKAITLRTLRSVYGPVIGRATVDGEPVVLTQARSTWFQEVGSLIGYAQLATPSASESAADLVNAIEFVSNQLAHYFVNKDAIAFAEGSFVPLRAKGVSGDFPVWGNGDWDWQGFDPDTHSYDRVPFSMHPQAINPASGVIASWNSQMAPGWSIADNKWTFGSFHRNMALERELAKVLAEGKASQADIVRAHTLAQVLDVTWASLWPRVKPMIGETKQSRLQEALSLLDDWVEAGAYRADFDGDGFNEHGAALHLADAWRSSLSHRYYDVIFGAAIVAEAGERNNLPPLVPHGVASSPSTPATLWQNPLMKDLAFYLDLPRRGDLSRRYCGSGKAADCRALLIDSLSEAIDRRSEVLGQNFSAWRMPSVCRDECKKGPLGEAYLQIEFTATDKAPAIAPIPWQNRPTFELTASFDD
ncbi:MAG: penicillin acylase family protein [Pseudomonadota bacterium]